MKGSENSYDFGSRMYDSRVGRFLSLDPKESELAQYSPYSSAGNSPISHIDANGENSIIVISGSQSDDGTGTTRIGHAGIVVEQFAKKTRMVSPPKGTSGLSQLITEYVSTGFVYYDLWPVSANMTDPTANVKPVYNASPQKFKTKADLITYLKTADITGSEGHAPDGVVEIQMSPELETKLNDNLKAAIKANNDYNAASNNCSSLVCEGLNSVGLNIDKEWGIFFIAATASDAPYYQEFYTPMKHINRLLNKINLKRLFIKTLVKKLRKIMKML